MAKHARDVGYSFNFDSVAVLKKENNVKKQKIHEIIKIIENDTIDFNSVRLGTRYTDIMEEEKETF